MDDTDIDSSEAGEDSGAVARRRLLRAGLGGAALSLLPVLARRASAGTTTTTPGSTASTAPATTTTAPPRRPTEDDVALLDFAQGVELAARQLYDGVLAAAVTSGEQRLVLGTIRESHSAYADSLSGLLGRRAGVTVDQTVVDELSGSFGAASAGVLDAAYQLESRLVATHLDILGQLQGTEAAALIASMVNVEARNGTVLAALGGKTNLDDLLVSTEAEAFSPAGG